jgi:putative membrane protein
MMGYGFGEVWLWLFGLLTVAGLVLLVVVAVRALGGGITRTPPASSPDASRSTERSRARKTLDVRYANGEIGTEEYRARLQAMRNH